MANPTRITQVRNLNRDDFDAVRLVYLLRLHMCRLAEVHVRNIICEDVSVPEISHTSIYNSCMIVSDLRSLFSLFLGFDFFRAVTAG